MSFVGCDDFQRAKRDQYVLPWYDRRYEYTVVDLDVEFQRLGIDTVLVNRESRHVTNVEEKIVRWPESGKAHRRFALETINCSGAPSWMKYSVADRLLYCFTQDAGWLDCWWVDFPALRDWFWDEDHDRWSRFKGDLLTSGRLVPIEEVCGSVRAHNFQLGG